MGGWRGELHDFVLDIERALRLGINRAERVFDRGAYAPSGYRGYGTREGAFVFGRVLQADESDTTVGGTSRWRNLRAALTRIESDPLPRATRFPRAAGCPFVSN